MFDLTRRSPLAVVAVIACVAVSFVISRSTEVTLEASHSEGAAVVQRIEHATHVGRLPLPIFVPSLPKSGTTTLWQYFLCGEQKASHWQVFTSRGKHSRGFLRPHSKDKWLFTGECVENNLLEGIEPFEDCGDYDIFADTGYFERNPFWKRITGFHNDHVHCYYPPLDALEEIYEEFPNATWLHVTRKPEKWWSSAQRWSRLVFYMKRCNATGLPGLDATEEDFLQFYEDHNERIRQFAKEHPSLTYVEVGLSDPDTPSRLRNLTGIDDTCFGHYNVNQN